MAEIWGAVAVAGAAVVGAVASNNAANKAANASDRATNASIGEQRRQYDQTRQDQMPWLQAGTDALGQMQRLNAGDFSQFYSSPDYTFARDEGLKGVDRGAAARGAMFSGGADADRIKFASGLASQNYGTFYARLQSLAGQGQTTAGGLGDMGMAMAGNIGRLNMLNADARASSYQQRANNYGDTAAVMGGAFNRWYQNRQAQQPPAYTGNGTGAGSMGSFGNNLDVFKGGGY